LDRQHLHGGFRFSQSDIIEIRFSRGYVEKGGGFAAVDGVKLIAKAGHKPIVTAPIYSDVTTTTATLGGNVTSDGGLPTAHGIVYALTRTTPRYRRAPVSTLSTTPP